MILNVFHATALWAHFLNKGDEREGDRSVHRAIKFCAFRENRPRDDVNQHLDALPSDIRGYHQRTKHAPTRYALGPAFLDWTSQPSPYRRFEGARETPMPLRDNEQTPPFPGPAPEPARVSMESLGLFLELALGLSAWKSVEGSTWALRNNPSSGNLHPTEAYVLLDALPGVGDFAGLYHYAPLAHALEERARYGCARVLAGEGFLVGLTMIPWREAWKYGERAFRYCQMDAGHAIGSLAQAASTLGWRAHVLSAPSDDEIEVLLGLDRADAFHRREQEHPDVLIWICSNSAPPPSSVMDVLLETPREFFGAANRLSEDHDGWPLVEKAAHFCRKPKSAVLAPSVSSEALPAFGPPIGQVVRGRRSAQRLDGATTMPRGAFGAMIAATLPGAPPLLSALSTPARVTLVLFVHRVEGLAPGLYLLPREKDATDRLRRALSQEFAWTPVDIDGLPLFLLRGASCEREATHASCLQPIAGKGCFSVAMIADFDRALAEDGAFAYRRLHWEAGLIGQALYLWASAAGLAGTGIGCFFDDEVHALLGLPEGDTQFQDIYHFTVGAPVEDARILTLPAYPDERRERL